MRNYQELIYDILTSGTDKDDRTGIGSRSVFGRMLRFDLSKGFPLLTIRKIPFRLVFEETMFFLRGETDTKKLEAKNVNIWKGNTSREFLDSRGLTHLPEGNMGKGYGHQWRNFGGESNESNGFYRLTPDIWMPHNTGIDQIRELIDGLTNDPGSRRHIVTAWNPQQLAESALPPCHLMHQYQVMDGKLNSMFSMRSNDVYLGLPFNIASYSLINMMFSHILNLEPGDVIYSGGDVHLYQNQIEAAKEIIKLKPLKPATLKFKKDFKTLDEMLELEYEDIDLEYEYHTTELPKVEMAI